tara:strand:+ start:365 stop:928 length:564 start_codon:yes stop_codon:yes gene_type:complete
MNFKDMVYEEKIHQKNYLITHVKENLISYALEMDFRDGRGDYKFSMCSVFKMEPVGKYLLKLYRTMKEVSNLENCGVEVLGYPLGLCYLTALEYLMELASPVHGRRPTISTTDVFWEVYKWQKEASENNPDFPPLTLDISMWPHMSIDFTLAMLDDSTANVKDEEKMHKTGNSIPLTPPGLTQVHRR